MAGHPLNHFALYPAHLFALLFVMALSKSTVLISSVLPPASVMLMAGITVSQWSHASRDDVAGRSDGRYGRFDAELPYRPADGAYPAGVTPFTAKHADKFLRVQHQLQKERTASSCCSRRVSWRCCVISCRWRPMLRLSAVRSTSLACFPPAHGRRCVCRRGHRHQHLNVFISLRNASRKKRSPVCHTQRNDKNT